jgi:hypothetical protein
LVLALVPFLRYSGRDLRFHSTSRRLRPAESATHALLGLAQFGLIASAFRANVPGIAVSGCVVAALGWLDELVFHRGLPAEESDLHAKSHISLFAFTAVALLLADLPRALAPFGVGR